MEKVKIIEVNRYFLKILMDRDLRNRFMFLVDLLNLISHSPHRLDKFRIAVGIVELFPQPSDMRHYGIIVVQKFFSPDIFKELL